MDQEQSLDTGITEMRFSGSSLASHRRSGKFSDSGHTGPRESNLRASAVGPSALTQEDSMDREWASREQTVQQVAFARASRMTIGNFIERKFATEYVACKKSSGRAFYQAMLKHVIMPEEVDRIFGMNVRDPRKTLKSLPDWPYMSELRLGEVRPEDVLRVTAAALMSGYSINTVKHIRNVIGAIFSHAIQEQCMRGENPVYMAKPPRRRRKENPALTPAQADQAINMMQYPEREMTLIGVFSGMSPAEITGLQWRCVNLGDKVMYTDEIAIPPGTVSIRNRWYRGGLESVQESWVRDLPINERLMEILLALKQQSRFTSPDDFVLVSRVGTPVNHDNVLARRLRPIARQLGVPSITWQAFRRNYEVFTSEMRKPRNLPSRAIPIEIAMNLGHSESSNMDLKKSA
jgi:integrase